MGRPQWSLRKRRSIVDAQFGEGEADRRLEAAAGMEKAPETLSMTWPLSDGLVRLSMLALSRRRMQVRHSN
jgi:hypothetical protein